MNAKLIKASIVAAAVLLCLAAAPAKHATPGGDVAAPTGGTPGNVATPTGPSPDGPPGGLVSYLRATGENCFLVFSNYGMFGCHTFTSDHGFHYNVGAFYQPERYQGLYSWTEAPSLNSYNDYVETTTTSPLWLQLPSSAGSVKIKYRAKWSIEEDFDGVELEIATEDAQTNWLNLQPTSAVRGTGQLGQPDTSRYYYEGLTNVWKAEEVDISSYKGKKVRFRFHFRSDLSNQDSYHGIYVDNFRVLHGTTEIYSNGFEDKQTDNWDTDVVRGQAVDGWGFSEALPAEVNFLNNGQLMVGSSSSYVCDAFVPDWKSTSLGWNKFVTYSNAETRSASQPEFRVDQYIYAYTDYVIVDCYIKNGKSQRETGIYAGIRMNIDIRHNEYERDDDERVIYRSSRRLAMFYDDGQLDQPVCGLKFLKAGNGAPASVNFTSTMEQWTDDAVNFTLMGNGEKDYRNNPSPVNRWAVVIGDGPFALNMSETYRFTFAILGGDDEDDLYANADAAKTAFGSLPDKKPISVTPTSFGNIKALFR